MGLPQEYTETGAVTTDCTPAESIEKLYQLYDDRCRALVAWVRLLRSHGDQYGPDVDRKLVEIEVVQDLITEKSTAEVR